MSKYIFFLFSLLFLNLNSEGQTNRSDTYELLWKIEHKDLDKPSATLMVSGDLFKVYFDEDVDLELIKKNLTTKQDKYQEEMNKISERLANKSFVDRAPKDIVDQEKTNYNKLKNDVERISITIKGI